MAEWRAFRLINGPLTLARLDVLIAALEARLLNNLRTKSTDRVFKAADVIIDFDMLREDPEAGLTDEEIGQRRMAEMALQMRDEARKQDTEKRIILARK